MITKCKAVCYTSQRDMYSHKRVRLIYRLLYRFSIFFHLSMEFLKPKGVGGAAKLKQQLLTVGDATGNLHVYDVPQNLWRPLANERAIMSNFLEREIKVTCCVRQPQPNHGGAACTGGGRGDQSPPFWFLRAKWSHTAVQRVPNFNPTKP